MSDSRDEKAYQQWVERLINPTKSSFTEMEDIKKSVIKDIVKEKVNGRPTNRKIMNNEVFCIAQDFGGVTELSRKLGVTQGYISNIVYGAQAISPRIRKALDEIKKIKPEQ